MKIEKSIKSPERKTIDAGTILGGRGGDIRTRLSGIITPHDGGDPYPAFEEREGHSYVYQFLVALYYHAAGLYNTDEVTYEGWSLDTYNARFISAHTPGTTARITVNLSGGPSSQPDEKWFIISQATYSAGTPSALNQRVYLNYISGPATAAVCDVYLNSAKTTPLNTSGEGAYDANSGMLWRIDTATDIVANSSIFNNPILLCGLGTKPLNVNDFMLDQPSIGLWQGAQGQIVDQPVVSPTVSRIRLTRDFNNTSGSAITVEEIMVLTEDADGQFTGAIGLARELQTIVVPHGSTLTLSYDLETNIDIAAGNNNGGITQWFNELMYRHLSGNNRSVTTITNGGHSESGNDETWCMAGLGGSELPQHSLVGYISNDLAGTQQWHLGPVLGTDDGTAVPIAQDNFELGGRIYHGRGIGQLWHHGSNVDSLEIRGGGWGYVDLTGGGAGSVDGITVNGVQIMSGAVAFNTSLTQTALDVAANINAHTSSPEYTASASGRRITIKAAETVGTAADGFAVVSSTTTITSTDTNLFDGNTASFKVRRLFQNFSGESMVVKEAGLVANVDNHFNNRCLLARYIRDGVSGHPAPTTIDPDDVVEVIFTVKIHV